jgi:hypothetical protein
MYVLNYKKNQNKELADFFVKLEVSGKIILFLANIIPGR